MAQYLKSQIDILENEVTIAQNMVLNYTTFSQAEIDAEAAKLNTTVSKFNAIGVNTSDFEIKINACKTASTNYFSNPTNYPQVTPDALTTFLTETNTVITEFGVLTDTCKISNSSFNLNDFNTEKSNLINRLTTTLDAFLALMNAVVVDKTALSELITQVSADLATYPEGTTVGKCPSKYRTPCANEISSANAIINKSNVTQTEIDAEYNKLTSLYTIFKDKIITAAFNGFGDTTNKVWYGPNPPTDTNTYTSWVPAKVVDGVYVSPEYPPLGVNVDGSLKYTDSMIGYYVDGSNVVVSAEEKQNYMNTTVQYGNFYFSTTFGVITLFVENITEDMAQNIYDQFTIYFEQKYPGVQVPSMSDEMFCSVYKKYYEGVAGSVTPETGWYLHVPAEFADFVPLGNELVKYFGCIRNLFV